MKTKINIFLVIGLLYLVSMISQVIKDIGETCSGVIYNWQTVVGVFIGLVIPFICGYLGGKNE